MPIGKRTQAWLATISDQASAKREAAAEGLATLSEEHFDRTKASAAERQQVLDGLAHLANDALPSVRKAVAQLVGLTRTWCPASRQILERALRDEAPEVLTSAAWALGVLGEPASDLTSHLLPLATTDARDVRWRVAWTLTNLGPLPAPAVDVAVGLAEDEEELVRMYATEAIGKAADPLPPEHLQVLLRSLGQEPATVECAACRALADSGMGTDRVLAKLLDTFRAGRGGADLVRALVTLRPETAEQSDVRAWLVANHDYWWAHDVLNGPGDS